MRRLPAMLAAALALAAAATLPAPAASAHAAWTWPVSGDVITPYRNGSDPYATGQHRGIDIAAPIGTPVVAAAGGEVRFAGTVGSSGLTVSVRTIDGYDTSYLHLSSLAVRAGAGVSAGDRIGAVGTTGTRSAAAPHLHFGVRDAGTRHDYHDPLALLPPPPVRAPSPRPAPPLAAPVPTPAPPAAAPAPVRRSDPRRSQPRPSPHRVPRPVAAPHRVSRPVAAPHRAPRPVAAPHLTPQPLPVPGRAPRRVAAPRGSRRPISGGAPRAAPRSLPQSLSMRSPRSAPAPGNTGSGPDIGWALACAGLLLAAAVLGLGGGRDKPGRDGGGRLDALRALAGRLRLAAPARVASTVDAVLRHHAHLLRQRRAASGARLYDDRG